MWYSWRTIRVVTFSTRRSLPHRQYSTREGNAGDEEINAVGLAGLRSWRKTGATRFPFAMESCPQNEHRNWSKKIIFRQGVLFTERTQELKQKDSLLSSNLVQNENRNWSDKISFLISNFRRELNVVCFLLGNSPTSKFYYADVSEHSVPSS